MNNNKMCGIYKITNMVNGKAYIGQAQNIEKRWNEHIHYTKNKNSPAYTKPLYKAMRKYGVENFSFEILILCEEELLNLMEIYYIEKYNSYIHAENSNGYNLTLGGEGTRGYVFSEEHKKKISENAKLRVGEKNPFYGKHHTEETKQKNSIAHRKYIFVQIDLSTGKEINRFSTIQDVCEYISSNNLSKAKESSIAYRIYQTIYGKQTNAYGYGWVGEKCNDYPEGE